MANPTILVAPGSFSEAHWYDDIVSHLNKLGFKVIVRDLPSADRRPPSPAATLADDAAYFGHVLNRLLAEGQDVVLMGHSYGGIVATECVKGLTGKGEGGRGSLRGLLYLTALMPKVGDSLSKMFEGQGELDFIKIEGEYMYHDPVELSAKVNFSDISLEEGIKWANRFTWHSALSFGGQCTYAGYEDAANVSFILCDKDETIKPEFQNKMIKEAGKARKGKGGSDVKVYHFDSGHCPNASKPKEVAELVGKVVGDMK